MADTIRELRKQINLDHDVRPKALLVRTEQLETLLDLADENAALKADVKRKGDALNLALEYWSHRQQRYKNRWPVWVQKAKEAITQPSAVFTATDTGRPGDDKTVTVVRQGNAIVAIHEGEPPKCEAFGCVAGKLVTIPGDEVHYCQRCHGTGKKANS